MSLSLWCYVNLTSKLMKAFGVTVIALLLT